MKIGVREWTPESRRQRCLFVILMAYIATSMRPVSGFLETTPAAVGGRLIACAGDDISLTCTHSNINTGRTTWRFSPPINCTEQLVHDHLPDNIVGCSPFSFRDVTRLTPGVTQLSSTAVATVSLQETGTFVECSDRSSVFMTNIGNVTLCIIDQPTISQVVNRRDRVEITWNAMSTECTKNVNYTVVVMTRGEPGNITYSSVITDLTSVVVSNLTDGEDYTVHVTASVVSCETQTAERNFTVDKAEGGGMSGDSNVGTVIAAVIVPVILLIFIAIVLVSIVVVVLWRKRLSTTERDNTKGHSTEVQNPGALSYAAVNFEKDRKGKPSQVEDTHKVVYSDLRQQDDIAESQGAPDIVSQHKPAGDGSSPQTVESAIGHHDTVGSSTAHANQGSFTHDQYITDRQQSTGVEPKPNSLGASKEPWGHTMAGRISSVGGSRKPTVKPRLGGYQQGDASQARSTFSQDTGNTSEVPHHRRSSRDSGSTALNRRDSDQQRTGQQLSTSSDHASASTAGPPTRNNKSRSHQPYLSQRTYPQQTHDEGYGIGQKQNTATGDATRVSSLLAGRSLVDKDLGGSSHTNPPVVSQRPYRQHTHDEGYGIGQTQNTATRDATRVSSLRAGGSSVDRDLGGSGHTSRPHTDDWRGRSYGSHGTAQPGPTNSYYGTNYKNPYN